MKKTKLLKVALNPNEVEGKLKSLSKASIGLLEAEIERKKVAGEFNQEIKAFKQEIKNICGSLESGSEMRDIDCDVRKNKKDNVFELVRLDTNEIVETTPMEGNELNEDLFDSEPGE